MHMGSSTGDMERDRFLQIDGKDDKKTMKTNRASIADDEVVDEEACTHYTVRTALLIHAVKKLACELD